MLEAGLAHAAREQERSGQLYGASADAFDAIRMPHYAAAARIRQAQLSGADEGERLRQRALAWFNAERIVNPARWLDMYTPLTSRIA